MLLAGWSEPLSSDTAALSNMTLVPDSSPGPQEEKRSHPRPRGPVSLSGLGQRLLEGDPAVLFARHLKPLITGCLSSSCLSQETDHRETGATVKPVTDPNKRGPSLGLDPRHNLKRGIGPHVRHRVGMHSPISSGLRRSDRHNTRGSQRDCPHSLGK